VSEITFVSVFCEPFMLIEKVIVWLESETSALNHEIAKWILLKTQF
jgi:hypothetical protein